MRSIRARLLVWILALLLPLVAAAGFLLVQAFGTVLLRDTDIALEEEVDTLSAFLSAPGDDRQIQAVLERVANETDLGTPKYVAVWKDGRLFEESPAGAAARLDTGTGLRVVRDEVRGARPPLTIAIGVPPAAAHTATQRLRSLLIVGLPLWLLAVGGGLWFVTGRALRPLTSAAQQLDKIALDNLAARIAVRHTDDEVGRLVAVVNTMLDRLDRAVARLRHFTADAAHELRTPLTVLRTGLDVAVSQERSAAAYRSALEEALASTDQVCRLAEDLLTLSRLDAQAGPAAVGQVDLAEILQELADAWSETALSGEVRIETVLAPRLIVTGNAGDLYRLFSNLIENALRATPKGGRIVLDAHREAGAIAVTISDSGPGIAPEDIERVFDRFYRGRAERVDGGTGLGLGIAREIVRLHGGQLALENRRGGGCTARVILNGAETVPLLETGT